MSLRQSPLRAVHDELGARLVEFGGWEMPLSYPGGTLSEHLACRAGAAVFDVSHLGTLLVEGRGSFSLLQKELTNDLGRISPGRAQYSHLLDEDGSVLDDLIVWWTGEERFEVMPNASNLSRVAAALGGRDTTAERAVIAIQGPTARSVLGRIAPEAAEVAHFGVANVFYKGVPVRVAGTGYTGEDGVECAVPTEIAAELFGRLVAAGAVPAGLGARDTLRLEAGLPLHGHELGPSITPLQAGLGWVIGWDKGPFRGREALVAERSRGVHRRLVGVLSHSRRPLRAGAALFSQSIGAGELTSGNYSPILSRGIGLGFLPAGASLGAAVQIDQRGTALAGQIVKPPFFRLVLDEAEVGS